MRTGILGVTLVKRLQGCVNFIYNSPILILFPLVSFVIENTQRPRGGGLILYKRHAG